MKKIGGNIEATVQIKQTERNSLGETVNEFKDLKRVFGFLDYMSGESSSMVYNAELKDTTHIFLCDYTELPKENDMRLIIQDKAYEVKLIDIPMGINHHMEIYLKYVGV